MRFFAALLLCLASFGARANEPLKLPDSMQFPQPVDSAAVASALIAAMTKKEWIVEKDTGEAITAYRAHRRLRLHMRVNYDGRGIAWQYLDSDNFHGEDAPDGGVLIHRKANAWLRELGAEVRLQLQPVVFARDPAVVVPVEPGASRR